MSGGGNGGGPPDKWTKFSVSEMDSTQVLEMLNSLAQQGYYSVAVTVECTDGDFVFVGGYSGS